MKMIFEKTIIVFALIGFAMNSIGQQPSDKSVVYFLADTVTIPKAHRVLEIGYISKLKYYAFFCRCIPPYKLYVNFNVRVDRIEPKVSASLPIGKYLSWQQLSDLFWEHGNSFPEKYKLIIVEKLNGSGYEVNDKLDWMIHKPLNVTY